MIAPQWEPPPGLRDPYVRRMPLDRAKWSREIRGHLPSQADYAVALMLASYGNKDGSRCRPSTPRLAADLGYTVKDPKDPPAAVKRSLARLAEYGWITLLNPGECGRGHAQEWQLSVSVPYAVERGWWDDGLQWMERPSAEPKRPGVRKGGLQRPPLSGQKGVSSDPLLTVKGVAATEKGGHQDPRNGVKGVSSDPPPGSTFHQGSTSHHSERFSFCTTDASARGAATGYAEDDELIIDEITEYLEGELGSLHPMTDNLIRSMAENGDHPKKIINAALARNDHWD